LDEPTSGLDPLMEKVFVECVLDLKKQGKSVLLSSHILSEVEKLCDRVYMIRKGETKEIARKDIACAKSLEALFGEHFKEGE
jgi:ABC-2 type transport system ATP-binding protein